MAINYACHWLSRDLLLALGGRRAGRLLSGVLRPDEPKYTVHQRCNSWSMNSAVVGSLEAIVLVYMTRPGEVVISWWVFRYTPFKLPEPGKFQPSSEIAMSTTSQKKHRRNMVYGTKFISSCSFFHWLLSVFQFTESGVCWTYGHSVASQPCLEDDHRRIFEFIRQRWIMARRRKLAQRYCLSTSQLQGLRVRATWVSACKRPILRQTMADSVSSCVLVYRLALLAFLSTSLSNYWLFANRYSFLSSRIGSQTRWSTTPFSCSNFHRTSTSCLIATMIHSQRSWISMHCCAQFHSNVVKHRLGLTLSAVWPRL